LKKTTPSWLRDAIMHRVSINVHSQQEDSVNILSSVVLIVLLFQENKSFGASYHLHSSSDVR
jgi:phospholipase C